MGTPDFAVASLRAVVAEGHEVAAVYTQPPRPAGRGRAARKSPVHDCADELGLPVRTPVSLKDEDAQAQFAALKLDLAAVVAYGLILPQSVLDAPRLGCINLHGSLLPRWRGAAPIQRAIMAGDTLTGVQVMRMEAGLDTGAVLMTEETRIFPFDTAGALHDRMAGMGAELLPRALVALERGEAVETPQAEEGVTYAKKINKSEARLDWSRSAVDIDRQIRGLSPFPGAWFELTTSKGTVRVKVLECALESDADTAGDETAGAEPGVALDDALLIATGQGAVRLTRLQREGKRVQFATDFLRGAPLARGEKLL